MKKRVFAILHEPASYTVDRNRAVYDKCGVRYCYMKPKSLAQSDIAENVDSLYNLSIYQLTKRLSGILRDNDIIIMNGYTGRIFIILFLLNIFYRKNIGLDSDTQLNIPTSFPKRLLKKLYLSTVFKNKNIYGLPGGNQSHKQLFRHYGMPDERIYLMPMVVDNESFRIPPKREQDKFTFLYVGRIIPIKNIEKMIEAFISAYVGNERVILRIVGNGSDLSGLENKYGHYDNIQFAGPKYGVDLRKEYSDASAFILPSSYEPWGLVVNEAMSAGLPVIVSNCVGASWDLVENRETGFIFKFDDKDDLESKMKKLVEDPDLYLKYSQNATRLMAEYWNYDLYRKCFDNFISNAK